MDSSNPQKVKLLEMSASTRSEGLTMAEVRNLCRTVDMSTSITAKRKSSGADDNEPAKRFLNTLQHPGPAGDGPTLDPKNGSCSFCGALGHTRQVCRKFERAMLGSKGGNPNLVTTPNQGMWDLGRIAALETDLKEARLKHELEVRLRALEATKLQNQQSGGPQEQTGQAGGGGYGGTSHGGHYKGKGKGSPYRGKGKGKGSWLNECVRCRSRSTW
jgi:hypothetical protein